MREEIRNNVKQCKYCKSEIPLDAKICPSCRKKQGIRIWKVIVVTVVVIAIVGAIVGGDNNPSVSNISQNNKTQEKEDSMIFDQNDTVSYGDIEYTVTGVEKYKSKNYSTAKSGYEFVLVNIRIENKSEDTISYNPFDWKMLNGDGNETDITLDSYDESNLESGNLQPGGHVEGSMIFEEPEGDKNLILKYYGDILLDEASFQIKIK